MASGDGVIGRQKKPSGHGKGKWHATRSLRAYRKKRDLRNRTQKDARRVNRQA